MTYTIELTKKSEKFLRKTDKNNQRRVKKRLVDLSENLRLGKPLTANLSGLWSLRFGKFRTIYKIFENKLIMSRLLMQKTTCFSMWMNAILSIQKSKTTQRLFDFNFRNNS